jgi:hypothetical protein
MYTTLEQAIADAKKVKAKYGYTSKGVICKTEYKAGTYHIGFHFDNGRMNVGDTGEHPDGNKYEILAIV